MTKIGAPPLTRMTKIGAPPLIVVTKIGAPPLNLKPPLHIIVEHSLIIMQLLLTSQLCFIEGNFNGTVEMALVYTG